MAIQKVIKAFRDRRNRSFLISSHQNLEGDAIGSSLAVAELLEYIGKKVILFMPEDIPDTYKFLPGIKKVRHAVATKKIDYDAAAIVDCTGLERLGDVKKSMYLTRPIINIDHHISNTNFGTINWVEPKMSCSGEQIYHLYKKMKVPISKRAALYMYIAMLTDTGSFRYSNTTAKTHYIVAELMEKGIDPTNVYRRVYEGTQRSSLALLSSALSTLDMTKDGKIAWVKVTGSMLKEHKASIGSTQDFVNFPRSIAGVKIALAFREVNRGMIKVSFRSNEGVDVNKLARYFKGGGHRSASGCTLRGNLGEVEEAVLLRAKQLLAGANG